MEFTIKQIQLIGSVSPYYNYANKISNISVKGRNSLVIAFGSNSDASLDNLVFPIVSAETYGTEFFSVGGGPYKYGEYQKDKGLILEPNELYYGDVPTMPVYISMVLNKDILPGLTTLDDVTAYISKDNSRKTRLWLVAFTYTLHTLYQTKKKNRSLRCKEKQIH